jgi:hypothetical protein
MVSAAPEMAYHNLSRDLRVVWMKVLPVAAGFGVWVWNAATSKSNIVCDGRQLEFKKWSGS